MNQTTLNSENIIWVSYKLGFEGAYAGFNKTCTITNDNQFIKKGTRITYKALRDYINRIATKKTRLIPTPDGIHSRYAHDDDLGYNLVRLFVANQIEFNLQGGYADISVKNLYDHNDNLMVQFT